MKNFTFLYWTKVRLRKIGIQFLLVMSIVLSYVPATASLHYELKLQPEEIQIQEKTINSQRLTEIKLKDGIDFRRVGSPGLPIIPLRFCVPANSDNYRVSISVQKSVPLTLQTPLASREEEGYKIENAETMDYSSSKIHDLLLDSVSCGDSPVWIDEQPAFIGGFLKVINVYVMPFRKDSIKDVISYFESLSVDIVWDNGTIPNDIRIPRFREIIEDKIELAKTIVDNPQDVVRNVPQIANMIKASVSENENYRYIVVTSKELAPSFEKLCALKRLKGYTSKVFYIEDILSDVRFAAGDTISGLSDDAGKLRSFLQYAYENFGTQFVLLGGNWSIIPIRYASYQSKGCADINYKQEFASDLYYCMPFVKWTYTDRIVKNTHNGRSCEHVITYLKNLNYIDCDLHIGRIPCRNLQEAESYLEKVESYEFNPGDGDASYLNRAFVTASEEMNVNYVNQGLRDTYHLAFQDGNLYEIVQTSESVPYTGTEIVEAINSNQWGYVDFQGHGNPEGVTIAESEDWPYSAGLHALDNEYVWMENQELNGLDCIRNSKYYNWSLSMSCSLAPLHSLERYERLKVLSYSFAESYILGKNYGGVAFYANSGSGITTESVSINNYFFRSLYNSSSNESITSFLEIGRFGSLTKAAKYPGLSYKDLVSKWNLIGDPTINLWLGEPFKIRYDNNTIIPGEVSTSQIIHVSNIDITNPEEVSHSLCELQNLTPLNTSKNTITTLSAKNILPLILPTIVEDATFYKESVLVCGDLTFGSQNTSYDEPTSIFSEDSNVTFYAKGKVTFKGLTEIKTGGMVTIYSPQKLEISNLRLLPGSTLNIFAPSIEMKSGVDFRQGSTFNFTNTCNL